jgi:pyruvate formate lyase activating enzyme
MHTYVREGCTVCGRCAELCLTGAIEKVGYSKESGEIINEVLKDEPFYKNSGGGMTLSGGEPMAQLDFTLEILKKAKEKDIHVCMETCGHASQAAFEAVARYVDIFLYDYKISDPDEHYKYTGVSSSLIMSNLRALDSLGKKIILRCPIIPSVNDNSKHFSGIAHVANELKNVLEINIEPYHPLGAGKAAKLDMEYPITDIGITDDPVTEKWIKEIASQTAVPVKKA